MVKSKTIWPNITGLIIVFLMMASAAMLRDGTFFGHSLKKSNETESAGVTRTDNADGSVTLNTSGLGAEITGYAGPVPVEIRIADNTIVSVTPLENSETPGFLKRVLDSGITDRWVGKSPEEALAEEVDAVTGATFTSSALISNVRTGLNYYESSNSSVAKQPLKKGVGFYCALLVVALGAVVPLFIKNKRYRIIQQILNAGVLGFWTGTFIDYTVLLGILSNGFGASASLVLILMLITAFIYPLFGKADYYCTWICPLGSLQELAGRCNPSRKLKLSAATVKVLRWFRTALWSVLMLALWTGFMVNWIDYELFTAFMVNEAAVGVTVAGVVFIIISLFVGRPYCRFVCPTGMLFRLSENPDNH